MQKVRIVRTQLGDGTADSYKPLPEKLRLFSDCYISISLFVTIKRPSETSVFRFQTASLQILFFVFSIPCDKFFRFGKPLQWFAASAVGMYHKDSGRAEKSVFLHQSLMVGRIGGHVDLEKTLHIHGFMYLRLVERVGFHFSARDAPVGIEIQQDGFVAWYRENEK